MAEIAQRIETTTDQGTIELAARFIEPTSDQAIGVMFCGGFKSDMMGSKASYLAGWAAMRGAPFIRFDYMGHGQSGGEFAQGTVSQWLDDSETVFERFADRPYIIVGSSMGGWLAMLLNQRLRSKGDERVAGLCLIAPAIDMTRDLMADTFTEDEQAEMTRDGHVMRPSDYGDPYMLTHNLIADGEQHLMFAGEIKTGCPVHILQGGKDDAVPVDHAQKLMSHLLLDSASMSLVPDGDHSLSRPDDLELLGRTLDNMIVEVTS